MKRYLIWIGAAVLVMALASPSMAQFKSWGHLEIESYWVQNPSLNNNLYNANFQGVGMRYRFNLGYGDPKTVMVVLGFEANSRGFGEGPADQGVQVIATSFGPTGSAGGSGPGVLGNASNIGLAGKTAVGDFGTDAIGLQVRHAYFDFTIPNTPLTMQVGMQNIVIGGFLGRFFINKDIPSYLLNFNFAPHTLTAMWLKGYKQNYYMDNDLDYYGLWYRLKQQMWNVEAWFLYANDRRSVVDTWNLQLASGSAAIAPQYPTAAPATYTYNIVETTTPRGYEQKPWWLGANVPVSLGNWKFEPTFVYLGGKYVDAVNGQVPGITSSADFSAYMGDLMVSYRLGPGLKFLVEGFYSTGRDGTKNVATGGTQNQFAFPGNTNTTNAANAANPALAAISSSAFSAGAGNENRNVFANGWSVFYYSNTELSYYAMKQLDPSGTGFIRANAEFNPFAWLNLNLNYLYIVNTANQYNSHILGIVGAANPGSGTGITPTPGGTDVNKSYIGSELNAIAKIAIYKDFLYTIGFGYFFPGDVYNTSAARSSTLPSSTNPFIGTADNAWSLLTNLRYVF